MTLKTDFMTIKDDAVLVSELADPTTHQLTILKIIGYSAYMAYGYAAYRLLRGGVKLARKSK